MLKYILLTTLISIKAFCLVPLDGVVSVCKTYPEINDPTSFPEKFNPTNNLARPSDNGFYEAEGEKITIYGRVMDSNCIPVSDAKIYIWQANKVGYVQYPIKTPNNRYHHQQWVDPNFTGTGVTNTDNLGRFQFITIKPGSFTKVTPHIHIRIEHKELGVLNSKFYFLDVGANKIVDTTKDNHVFFITDKQTIDQITAVPGTKPRTYNIDITMNKKIKERQF